MPNSAPARHRWRCTSGDARSGVRSCSTGHDGACDRHAIGVAAVDGEASDAISGATVSRILPHKFHAHANNGRRSRWTCYCRCCVETYLRPPSRSSCCCCRRSRRSRWRCWRSRSVCSYCAALPGRDDPRSTRGCSARAAASATGRSRPGGRSPRTRTTPIGGGGPSEECFCGAVLHALGSAPPRSSSPSSAASCPAESPSALSSAQRGLHRRRGSGPPPWTGGWATGSAQRAT